MKQLWTEQEIIFLQNNYKNKKAKYCASYLNKTIAAVRQKAKRLGLAYRVTDLTKKEISLIKSLNKRGYSDSEIARQLNKKTTTVNKARKRMNLPSVYTGEVASKINQRGAKTRTLKRQQLALEYNLPTDLKLLQIAIIVLLAHHGFMTKMKIASLLSMPPKYLSIRYLPDLLDRGLVTSSNGYYILTSTALILLGKGNAHRNQNHTSE
jgi:DNA-binding MarR family transcriptional regulator